MRCVADAALQDIESYNTRLFKCEEEEGGKVCYELRLASAMTNGECPGVCGI